MRGSGVPVLAGEVDVVVGVEASSQMEGQMQIERWCRPIGQLVAMRCSAKVFPLPLFGLSPVASQATASRVPHYSFV
jgi:hypothetical protein